MSQASDTIHFCPQAFYQNHHSRREVLPHPLRISSETSFPQIYVVKARLSRLERPGYCSTRTPFSCSLPLLLWETWHCLHPSSYSERTTTGAGWMDGWMGRASGELAFRYYVWCGDALSRAVIAPGPAEQLILFCVVS